MTFALDFIQDLLEFFQVSVQDCSGNFDGVRVRAANLLQGDIGVGQAGAEHQ